MNIQEIIEQAGFAQHRTISKLSGGDINAAYRFTAENDPYFIKINDAEKYPELFQKESNGLNEIRKKSRFKIPEIVKVGGNDRHQYLILEFLPEGNATEVAWIEFAANLANMHQVSNEAFGFYENNYLGTQPQDNSHKNNWADFYAENRILPAMKQMFDKGIASRNDLKNTDRLCARLAEIYPSEKPSLIHGDLWAGNYFVTESSEITVIDPAVYYGHREMDLAMAMLFGGFPETFYKNYFECFPVAPGFQERVEVSQLYPLIFHAVRFGGSYITSVQRILKKFG